MLKAGITCCLLIGAALAAPTASADIVAKEFSLPGTGKTESGFVLQGSRKMKKLGKGEATATITVPPFSPLPATAVPTVIPSLETAEIKSQAAKPRFGYGSDYRPEAEPVEPPLDAASFAPIYQKPYPTYTPWYYHPGPACYYQPYFGTPSQPGLFYQGSFFHGGSLSFSWGGPFFGYYGCP